MIRIKTLLILSAMLGCSIFLSIPYSIYRGNLNEFVAPFTSIVLFFALPFMLITFAITAIGFLTPKEYYQRYVSMLFMCCLLIWLQGNILVWRYGFIDGHGIEWSEGAWRGWIDSMIWIGLLSIAFVFYRKIARSAPLAGVVMIFLQLVSIALMSYQSTDVWNKRFPIHIEPPRELYEFSQKQNVIHILLDDVQSPVFQEIIEKDRNHYYSSLEGFTFFNDTAGSFPTTYMSIPAIFSGQNYDNSIPMATFLNKVLNGRTIPNILYDRGFDVDLVTESVYGKAGRYSSFYTIPVPYGLTKKDYVISDAALMIDLVLFRCTPHFLKRFIYRNQPWFFQGLVYVQPPHFAHKVFLSQMINRMSVKSDKPAYKFVHLMTPHAPYVVDKNCEYVEFAEGTEEDVKMQLQCSLDDVIEFLNKLKILNIYDSSLIILNADHGNRLLVDMENIDKTTETDFKKSKDSFRRMVGSALPLMAIKRPYAKGILKISGIQATLSDIPATIGSVLGITENLPGRSVFQIGQDEERERIFHDYVWRHKYWKSDYFPYFQEYTIKGPLLERDSWRLSLTRNAPD